jgi:hypothetical protein
MTIHYLPKQLRLGMLMLLVLVIALAAVLMVQERRAARREAIYQAQIRAIQQESRLNRQIAEITRAEYEEKIARLRSEMARQAERLKNAAPLQAAREKGESGFRPRPVRRAEPHDDPASPVSFPRRSPIPPR